MREDERGWCYSNKARFPLVFSLFLGAAGALRVALNIWLWNLFSNICISRGVGALLFCQQKAQQQQRCLMWKLKRGRRQLWEEDRPQNLGINAGEFSVSGQDRRCTDSTCTPCTQSGGDGCCKSFFSPDRNYSRRSRIENHTEPLTLLFECSHAEVRIRCVPERKLWKTSVASSSHQKSIVCLLLQVWN